MLWTTEKYHFSAIAWVKCNSGIHSKKLKLLLTMKSTSKWLNKLKRLQAGVLQQGWGDKVLRFEVIISGRLIVTSLTFRYLWWRVYLSVSFCLLIYLTDKSLAQTNEPNFFSFPKIENLDLIMVWEWYGWRVFEFGAVLVQNWLTLYISILSRIIKIIYSILI